MVYHGQVCESLSLTQNWDGSLNYPVGGTHLGGGLPFVPRPTATPITSTDSVTCYNVGLVADSTLLTQAIDTACNRIIDDSVFGSDATFREQGVVFPWQETSHSAVEVVASADMKDGCIWSLDKVTCQSELTKILKACGNGQGGTMENNCMAWRLDPNGKDGDVPPSSTATATAAPTPTMLTCKLTGYNIIHLTCGCSGRGGCTWCNGNLGFDLRYDNDHDDYIGGSNYGQGGSNPISVSGATIPANELGYVSDIVVSAHLKCLV
jgi:hypothetical protein